MRTLLISALFFALVSAHTAWSQVAISNADTTWQSGSTKTIYGAGFGAKVTPQPFMWDDLDWPAYAGLSDGDPPPTRAGSYGHPQDDDAPWAKMDGSSHSGSIRYETSPEDLRVTGRPLYSITQGRGAIREISFLHQDYLFLDYWFYSESARSFPIGDDGLPDGSWQSKLIRLWPDPNKLYGHNSIYPGRVSYDPGPTHDDKIRVWSPLYPEDGQWTHITVWIDGSNGMSEGNSHGIFKAWADNQLIFDVDDMGWLTGGEAGGAGAYTFLALVGLDPVERTDHIGKKNLMGDIYLDTTQARVMIGDASTWDAVSHFEMQIPQEWSNDSITVAANLGSFSSSDQLWLYVFNEDGVYNNNGYLIDSDTPLGGPGIPGTPQRND